MTHEETNAGREMDILIERRVFGNEFDERGIMNVRPFSTDEMGVAWLVVEKMRERNVYVGFDSNALAPDVWRFWAQDEEGEYLASGEARTAPVAICRMALMLANTPEVKP